MVQGIVWKLLEKCNWDPFFYFWNNSSLSLRSWMHWTIFCCNDGYYKSCLCQGASSNESEWCWSSSSCLVSILCWLSFYSSLYSNWIEFNVQEVKQAKHFLDNISYSSNVLLSKSNCCLVMALSSSLYHYWIYYQSLLWNI